MKLINTALIGIGYWGKVHFKYLKKIKKTYIKSIYFKKNKQILKDSKINKHRLTNNLNEILNDKSIRFVDIVTPIDSHADLAIKFLKKGKNVLVEKPLMMNKKEEKKILDIAKRTDLLTVSYPYLFSKSLNHEKKIILSKKLGKLIYIEMNIQQCGRFMKYGVNHLLAPHAISVLSIFFNIDKIRFRLKNIIRNNNKAETSITLCYLKKKLVSTINLSLNYASSLTKKNFVFYCDKGTIICDLNDKNKTISSFLYKRIVKKNFTIAKKIPFKSNYFNENNNMKFVLEDFFKKKSNLNNLKLTKKINTLLHNG